MTDWTHRQLSMSTDQGIIESCTFEYKLGHPVELIASSPSIGRLEISADDLFEALNQVRLAGEKNKFLLLCNGARADSYPSRMSRQMRHGAQTYIFKYGVHAKRDDLVDLLDPATYDQVTTVAEQKKNFDDWLNSLGH